MQPVLCLLICRKLPKHVLLPGFDRHDHLLPAGDVLLEIGHGLVAAVCDQNEIFEARRVQISEDDLQPARVRGVALKRLVPHGHVLCKRVDHRLVGLRQFQP